MKDFMFKPTPNLYLIVQSIIEKTKYLDNLDNAKKPEYYDAYVVRGHNYATLEELGKAETDFDLAIRCDPNRSEAYICKAIANIYYYGNDKPEKIIFFILENIERAIEKDPNNSNYYCIRGAFYSDLKKHDLAKKDLTRALELNPNNSEAYYYLGCLSVKHNLDQAIEYFNKALNNPVQDRLQSIYYNLGMLHAMKKEYNSAIEYGNLALEINPSVAEIYYFVAHLFFLTEQYINASIYSDAATTLDQKNPYYFILKAKILEKLGNHKGAEAIRQLADDMFVMTTIERIRDSHNKNPEGYFKAFEEIKQLYKYEGN